MEIVVAVVDEPRDGIQVYAFKDAPAFKSMVREAVDETLVDEDIHMGVLYYDEDNWTSATGHVVRLPFVEDVVGRLTKTVESLINAVNVFDNGENCPHCGTDYIIEDLPDRVTRDTRAGSRGKAIYCSHCCGRELVFHFGWKELRCGSCSSMVEKTDWFLYPHDGPLATSRQDMGCQNPDCEGTQAQQALVEANALIRGE